MVSINARVCKFCTMADGWVNSVSFAEAQRLWCCAVLGRWLQLYMLGDPENAEAELADELAGIYKDALPTTKSMFSSLPASFLHHSLPSPLALYDIYTESTSDTTKNCWSGACETNLGHLQSHTAMLYLALIHSPLCSAKQLKPVALHV